MSDHWKSLAEQLGAPGLSSAPSKPTENAPPPSSQVPNNDQRSLAHSAPPPPVPTNLKSATDSQANPEPPAAPAKIKKRSSWERLASLFDISADRQPALETVAENSTASTAIPAASADPAELSIFKPNKPTEKNQVLTDMFGQTASTPHEQWGKPRKVVDDLGWDDIPPFPPEDDDVKSIASPSELKTLDNAIQSNSDDRPGSFEESDDPERRSRRERRNRGRGRGARFAESNRDSDDRPSSSNRPTSGRDELKSSWDDLADAEEVPLIEEDDVDEIAQQSERESEPDDERRSRRRRGRRGGRDRGGDRERGSDRGERGRGGAPEQRPAEDERVESINRELLYDDDDESIVDADFEQPLAGRSASDQPDGERSRRRRKRNRGGKPTDATKSLGSDDRDVDSSDDSTNDGEEDSIDKHRNIPTWEDSLASLIEANIDNHRRNDGRGPRGGGGGGRGSRGRR